MSIGSLNANRLNGKADEPRQINRRRLLIQQFMNDMAPAIRTLIGSGESVDSESRISQLIEALNPHIDGHEDVEDLRENRILFANIYALSEQSGLSFQDVSQKFRDLLERYEASVPLRNEMYPDISSHVSMRLTSMNVTAALAVAIRANPMHQDPVMSMKRLSEGVLRKAEMIATSQSVDKADDLQTLLQTASNRLVEIMVAVYEKVAAEENLKASALDSDPLETVLLEFGEWSDMWAQTANNYAEDILAPKHDGYKP